jgi:large subunit ribosomal protein L7/L12
MTTIHELGELIAKLTLVEAVELKTYLKDRYQIEPTGASVPVIEEVDDHIVIGPEPTEFSVFLEAIDPTKKIVVIKAVRELTGQGLAEAKATVEGLPRVIRESVDKIAAEETRKKLEEAGATVSVKPV